MFATQTWDSYLRGHNSVRNGNAFTLTVVIVVSVSLDSYPLVSEFFVVFYLVCELLTALFHFDVPPAHSFQ